MNYENIYNQLIEKRKLQPAKEVFNYSENHHIIPRSINSLLEFDKDNIVSLSAREHFIAHLLLVKIYEDKNEIAYYKMLYAFNLMCQMNKNKVEYSSINFNSKLYEKIRIKAAKEVSKNIKNYWLIPENKEKILR